MFLEPGIFGGEKNDCNAYSMLVHRIQLILDETWALLPSFTPISFNTADNRLFLAN